MPIKARRKVVFSKVEATYGVDPVPVAATDALLVRAFSCVPVELQYEERDPALPFFGNQGQIKAGEFMRMEYDIEAAGAGAVDSAPKYGSCLKGAVLSETITPATGPVTYAPISSGEQSCTQYFYWDGLLHKMLGARAEVSLRMRKGQVPLFHFTWTGLYGGISDVALASPTLTGFQKPLAVNKANTTFSLHGYAAPLEELTIDLGNEINYRNLPNSETVNFVGRKTLGSVTIELPLIATKDFFTIVRNATLGALASVHGTAAGNKVLIDAANVQLTNPRYSEPDGIAMLQMGLEIQPSGAGNDEVTFKTQ
ncbi:MAG: hypothetical protein HYU77_13875 [Betaproteobacteria bacterium]|nr:hypothetical protein [Betaproteobacteria bacterium]